MSVIYSFAPLLLLLIAAVPQLCLGGPRELLALCNVQMLVMRLLSPTTSKGLELLVLYL